MRIGDPTVSYSIDGRLIDGLKVSRFLLPDIRPDTPLGKIAVWQVDVGLMLR